MARPLSAGLRGGDLRSLVGINYPRHFLLLVAFTEKPGRPDRNLLWPAHASSYAGRVLLDRAIIHLIIKG